MTIKMGTKRRVLFARKTLATLVDHSFLLLFALIFSDPQRLKYIPPSGADSLSREFKTKRAKVAVDVLEMAKERERIK